MIIKTLIVLQQEIGETKKTFLDKVEQIENAGHHMINQRCYDIINNLAEITLEKDFNFEKVDAIPGITVEDDFDPFFN